ncbi:MAG: NADAR family protein [Algibacter sp.]
MKYSIEQLKERFDKDELLKYIFFWGHTPSKDGSIQKSCFSQWWLSDFEIGGALYKTAEHWMMAEKARLFDNEVIRLEVLKTPHPNAVKKLGRKVKGFDSEKWNAHKYEIVKQGNYHKFIQNRDLKDFLLDTGDRIIVEASPLDPVWGIGLSQDDTEATNPHLWKGDNLLGFALMEVRDMLREE